MAKMEMYMSKAMMKKHEGMEPAAKKAMEKKMGVRNTVAKKAVAKKAVAKKAVKKK